MAPDSQAAESSTSLSRRRVERAPLGNSQALSRLVSRCLPGVTRWAHRRLPRWVRTADDTSDLVQEAALQTIRKLHTFDVQSRDALGAYLREAVRNRIRDEHRRFARRGVHDAPADALVDPSPSPLDEAITRERQARYRAALARLRRQDRELIVAHVELDYTHEQLGCMTGRSRNAARMALERAVRQLAEQMRDG
jgi:RNA polymerase sigma factor (sigma-70 family)